MWKNWETCYDSDTAVEPSWELFCNLNSTVLCKRKATNLCPGFLKAFKPVGRAEKMCHGPHLLRRYFWNWTCPALNTGTCGCGEMQSTGANSAKVQHEFAGVPSQVLQHVVLVLNFKWMACKDNWGVFYALAHLCTCAILFCPAFVLVHDCVTECRIISTIFRLFHAYCT